MFFGLEQSGFPSRLSQVRRQGVGQAARGRAYVETNVGASGLTHPLAQGRSSESDILLCELLRALQTCFSPPFLPVESGPLAPGGQGRTGRIGGEGKALRLVAGGGILAGNPSPRVVCILIT